MNDVVKTGAAILDVLEGRSRWHVEHSDALIALRSMPDACVDAIVTDPPSGIGFMGRSWDKDKGGRTAWVAWLAEIMREAYRVLKPGGHALVWALPRTSHWTGWALEEAGFELRDTVLHLFGTGFPKSLDVSKAIDAAAGAARAVVGPVASPAGNGNGTNALGGGWQVAPMVTAPATPEAAAAAGWGTALKPAHEVWWLARKPLIGTIAANWLEHGTGALNIDGCRIATDWSERSEAWKASGHSADPSASKIAAPPGNGIECHAGGRWPANVALSHGMRCWPRGPDDYLCPVCGEVRGSGSCARCATSIGKCEPGCPVRLLDEQSGETTSSPGVRNNGRAASEHTVSLPPAVLLTSHADSGGASRFFFVAKPSTGERESGLGEMAKKSGAELTGSQEGQARLDSPRTGAGRGGNRANVHPTVKSVELMRWLSRLVTPPGGLVLDAFAGSGSTGMACVIEGFRFIGIELDADGDGFVEIARKRIGGCRLAKRPVSPPPPAPAAQGKLFG